MLALLSIVFYSSLTMKQPSHISSYQAAVLQSRAHRVIKEQLSDSLRKHDITMMQWSIIGLLSDAGNKGLRISDLAKTLDTSLAFVTTSVNVLAAKDIVYRESHANDNRAKIVRLSKSFAPKVKAIETELSKRQEAGIFSHFDATDVATYFKVLQQIAERA
jgi:DNA-binding MarR family transcriptional regulator